MDPNQVAGLVRTSPDLVYVLDSQGRFSFLDGACEEMIGCPSRELVGRHFTEIICPDDTERAQWRFNERRTGRRATRGHQIRLRVRNGRCRQLKRPGTTDVQLDAFGIWSDGGSAEKRNFLGTIGVAKDVSSGTKPAKTRNGAPRRNTLSKSLVGLLDEEKSKIAAELHDNVGQLLVSIKMDLERIRSKIDVAPGPMNELVEAAIGKSVEAIKDLREIAQGLRPAALEYVDLVAALHNLFEDIKNRSGVRIHFFHDKVPKEIDFPVKLAFFRIAQEALTNVIKHSKATEAHFTLSRRGNTLMMTAEDDGVGFDPNNRNRSAEKPTLGLCIMEERATQMGGELSIESSRGQGTHLLVEIPL